MAAQRRIEVRLHSLIERFDLLALQPADYHYFAGPAMDVVIVRGKLTRLRRVQ